MKRIFVILLALILSSMILIVGNASIPASTSGFFLQQTPWYFPIAFSNSVVNGGIEIEGGTSLIQGSMSIPLDVEIEFWASSQVSEVKYLRVCTWYFGSGCEVDDVAHLPWEPYVSNKTYTISLINDRHQLFVHVQYRDNDGNLSRVYTDDIFTYAEPHYTTTAAPIRTATPTPTPDPP